MGGSDRDGSMSSSSCMGKWNGFTKRSNYSLQRGSTAPAVYHLRRTSKKGRNGSYQQLFRTDPVVLGELDIKLDVKISLVKGVSVLRHALSSHHPDWAWRQEKFVFSANSDFPHTWIHSRGISEVSRGQHYCLAEHSFQEFLGLLHQSSKHVNNSWEEQVRADLVQWLFQQGTWQQSASHPSV